MDGKDLNDPLNNVTLIKDDQTRTNLVSSGDSEKMIQRVNDELREAQEMANTEKLKSMELQASLEKERKEKKQQSEDSAKQIQVLQGQLQQLHEEVGSLREQLKGSSSSQDELQKSKEEVKSLKRALDEAEAERAVVSKDLDKWHQTATKYEREMESLQRDLQQQSKQWQKTAEIQANELQSVQLECNNLQRECATLRSEKQETVMKHQKEKSTLQSECATLKAEKDNLIKNHQKEKSSLQSECSNLRSENEAAIQKQQQLEKDLASSRAKNSELTNSLKNLEKSKQDLEEKLSSLELNHQEESAKLQVQLDEANTRSDTLQNEPKTCTTDKILQLQPGPIQAQDLEMGLVRCAAATTAPDRSPQRSNADDTFLSRRQSCDNALGDLSNIKEKCEKTEQQNQLLTEELNQCKESMKEIQEKGTKTSLLLPIQAIAIGLVLALLHWCFGALW